MTTSRRWQMFCAASLGLGLSLVTGCQTWVAGMTLPSPHYLEHRPQYFPPDPDFPLQKELNTQLTQSRAAEAAVKPIAGVVPQPVVPPGGVLAPTPVGTVNVPGVPGVDPAAPAQGAPPAGR